MAEAIFKGNCSNKTKNSIIGNYNSDLNTMKNVGTIQDDLSKSTASKLMLDVSGSKLFKVNN